MRRILSGLIAFAATVGCAALAGAQTPSPAPSPDARIDIAAVVSGAAVQKAGGLFGGHLSFALSKRLALVAEVSAEDNVATRRRIQNAQALADFLSGAQGQPASASLTAPAVLYGGGLRFTWSSGLWQPYIEVLGGGARVTLQPKFILGSADVTSSLTQYGVILGSDLTGTQTVGQFTALFGLAHTMNRWTLDIDLGVSSLHMSGQAANVVRVGVNIGRKF